MDIKGLTLNEVAEKIKEYLPLYLQNNFQFQESYVLDFDEINHNIPEEYHKYFNAADKINNACGSVEADELEYNYNIILLSNHEYTRALFLLLQKENKTTGEMDIELLKSLDNTNH